METDWVRWAWIGLAVFMLVTEMFTMSFVLACFGIGAAIAAALAFFNVAEVWQVAAFVVVSGILVFYTRAFADKVTGEQAQLVGVDRVLGKQAVVIEAINQLTDEGKVRVNREIWRAESEDGTDIEKGKVVDVIEVTGTRLKVKLAETNEA